MSCAVALIALVSSRRLVVALGLMLGLLLRCSLACAADEATPPVLCPPQFLSAPSGQTLEAHATACADWSPSAVEGVPPPPAITAAPATSATSTEWREPSPAVVPVSAAGGSGVAATVARETSLAMAEVQPEHAASWRQVPGLRWLGQMRLQGGGLVLKDAGAQYFLKLRGIRGVRLGVKLAF
jgi:hypothetical protein